MLKPTITFVESHRPCPAAGETSCSITVLRYLFHMDVT